MINIKYVINTSVVVRNFNVVINGNKLYQTQIELYFGLLEYGNWISVDLINGGERSRLNLQWSTLICL